MQGLIPDFRLIIILMVRALVRNAFSGGVKSNFLPLLAGEAEGNKAM